MKRPDIEKMKRYIEGLPVPILDIPSTKGQLIATIYSLIQWIEKLEGAEKESPDNQLAKEIMEFLNEKTGRRYPPVEANLRLVRGRIKEHGAKAVRQVIAMKCREWGSDEKLKEYLRPKTLFGATNFANYVGKLGGA